MITLIVLIIMALLMTIIAVFLLSIGGTFFMVIAADLIVCVLFIVWVIKKLRK